MAGKTWVDICVALAPTVVAIAVVGVTFWQNTWQRGAAARQHAIELRQLRFSLFEKRLEVLKVVSGVLARFSVARGPADDRNEQLFQCLLEGQTLFHSDIADRLQIAWRYQVALYNMNLDRPASTVTGGAAELDDRIEKTRLILFGELKALQTDMIKATRIEGPVEISD